MPSPLLRRPRIQRPETAGSNVPQLRRREGIAEVVSASTQTSPPTTSAGAVGLQGNVNDNIGGRMGDLRQREEYLGTNLGSISENAGTGTSGGTSGKASFEMRVGNVDGHGRSTRTRRKRQVSRTDDEHYTTSTTRESSQRNRHSAESSSKPRRSRRSRRPADRHNHGDVPRQSNLSDIESVGQAMEEYYRSQESHSQIPISTALVVTHRQQRPSRDVATPAATNHIPQSRAENDESRSSKHRSPSIHSQNLSAPLREFETYFLSLFADSF
jgi:hypothetical protein